MKVLGYLFGSFLLITLFGSSVFAQAQRTFVSGLVGGGNPCNRVAPCRQFTEAISKTAPGGEVIVLDSAGYGTFTITQPVSVIAPPGVYAGISVFSGDGIDINVGPTETVILRGLTIINHRSTGGGVVFSTGGTLHIENCVISGFPSNPGVRFQGSGTLEVKDSIMIGNNSGILVRPTSGTALATVDHVRLEGNFTGLDVEPGSKVTIRNSLASGNEDGFTCFSDNTASAELNIESCIASNNALVGIQVQATSTGVALVRLSNSTVTDNGFAGLFQSGGRLLSRGNNTVEGNATDTMGTIGSYSAK
jgi:hypothetical protein